MRTIDLESVQADNSALRGWIEDDGFETFLGLWKLKAGGSWHTIQSRALVFWVNVRTLNMTKGEPSRLDMSSNEHSL